MKKDIFQQKQVDMSIICSVCITFREMGLEFVEVIKKKKSWSYCIALKVIVCVACF